MPSRRFAADPQGPLFAYRARRAQGALEADPAQELAAEKLQSLFNALRHYRPAAGAAGWRARLGLAGTEGETPQGLYIYGGVGRGKSMLMDLFFAVAPPKAKRRAHFHPFMLEVQRRLHEGRGRKQAEPLNAVADALAREAWLLCFDEFHVYTIADAMILGRLFEALLQRGVVVVATSNWAPDDLYKDGLQRERFLPFIDMLKHRLDVLHLEGARDFRLARLRTMEVYHHPLDEEADKALDRAFAALTDNARGEELSVPILGGRSLTLKRTALGVARAGFAELCQRPLGAADYLALAESFHTLILAGVPQLGPERHNEARRFMTLVDALYEHRVNLVLSAERPPHALYPQGQGAFEFQRTISRLIEMRSAEYIAAPHRP
ncbi:MAG: cell division protein ZapE [Rhodospirillales bacterium]